MDCSAPKAVSLVALTASAAHDLGCLWLKACDGVSGTTYSTRGGICSFSGFYGNPTLIGLAGPWLSVPMPVPCFALGSRVVLALGLLVIWIWGFRVKGADTVALRSLFLHLFPSLGSATLSLVPEQRDISLLALVKILQTKWLIRPARLGIRTCVDFLWGNSAIFLVSMVCRKWKPSLPLSTKWYFISSTDIRKIQGSGRVKANIWNKWKVFLLLHAANTLSLSIAHQ